MGWSRFKRYGIYRSYGVVMKTKDHQGELQKKFILHYDQLNKFLRIRFIFFYILLEYNNIYFTIKSAAFYNIRSPRHVTFLKIK